MKQVNMKKDYREKLTSFRIACRIYYKEKDEMHRIEMEHPSFKQDVQQDSVVLDWKKIREREILNCISF